MWQPAIILRSPVVGYVLNQSIGTPIIRVFYQGAPISWVPSVGGGPLPNPFPTTCDSALDIPCQLGLLAGKITVWVFGWNLFIPQGVADMKSYLKNDFNSLLDFSLDRVPWAYTTALASVDLSDPALASPDGTVPDYHLSALTIQYKNLEGNNIDIPIMPNATVSGSVFVKIEPYIPTIRNAIKVVIGVLLLSSILALTLTGVLP